MTFVSDGHGNLVIRPDGNYIRKLVELLGVEANREKATPTTSTFQHCHEGYSLDSEKASKYRTGVGVLLYMCADRPDVQAVVRHLAEVRMTHSSVSMDEAVPPQEHISVEVAPGSPSQRQGVMELKRRTTNKETRATSPSRSLKANVILVKVSKGGRHHCSHSLTVRARAVCLRRTTQPRKIRLDWPSG